jgi:hypothetical protein
MVDDLELDRLGKLLDESKRRLLKFEHPYVGDIIGALKSHPQGRPGRRVIELLESERQPEWGRNTAEVRAGGAGVV